MFRQITISGVTLSVVPGGIRVEAFPFSEVCLPAEVAAAIARVAALAAELERVWPALCAAADAPAPSPTPSADVSALSPDDEALAAWTLALLEE